MTQLSTRIRQKFDTLENWNNSDSPLLLGELAIAYCGNQIRFKVGNGEKPFSELKFIDQMQLSTQNLYAQSIAQGISAYTLPTGLAAGINVSAEALASQAIGFRSIALSNDSASFVWNGDDTLPINELYRSHGKGTFSINPLSGSNGFYIGENSISTIIDNEVMKKSKVTFVDWTD